EMINRLRLCSTLLPTRRSSDLFQSGPHVGEVGTHVADGGGAAHGVAATAAVAEEGVHALLRRRAGRPGGGRGLRLQPRVEIRARSEEHTSELQSRENLVCRLLL